MARVSIYLNFMGRTEEAFNFYKLAFGTEFGPIMRMGDVPAGPDQPALTDAEKEMIMHIELPILDGTILMGTDALESMGHRLTMGNNVSINLEPDTREDVDRLFNVLSEGGTDVMEPQDMFWGSYFSSFADRFGLRWMLNFETSS